MDPASRAKAQQTRDLVTGDAPVVLGGMYDGVSARLVERAGFPAAFIGGYAVAASHLGEPDIGLLSQSEIADTARRLCRLVECPVLVDADTGYGGATNALRTAELFSAAGAAGLFLEDQVWPKRCGHMAGKQVTAPDEWLDKLRAIRHAPETSGLFLVARTDARAPLGLEAAIERGRAARDLGADAIFIEAPESAAEFETIAKAIPGPKVANLVEGGKSPHLHPKELFEMGFSMIVFPVAAILAQAHTVERVFQTIRDTGSTASLADSMFDFDAFAELLDLSRHRARTAGDSTPKSS